MRSGSAALDLAYVAAGRSDGHWELGLKPWDTAAGALIVQEAGGRAHLEYWIPAEELDAFNAAIVGKIEVVHAFGA